MNCLPSQVECLFFTPPQLFIMAEVKLFLWMYICLYVCIYIFVCLYLCFEAKRKKNFTVRVCPTFLCGHTNTQIHIQAYISVILRRLTSYYRSGVNVIQESATSAICLLCDISNVSREKFICLTYRYHDIKIGRRGFNFSARVYVCMYVTSCK